MNDTIKKSFSTFLRGLVPLICTLIGSVLGSLCGVESVGSAVGATIGVFSASCV